MIKNKKTKLNEKLLDEIKNELKFLLDDRSLPNNVFSILQNIEKRLEKNLSTLEISHILYELEEKTSKVNAMESRSAIWELTTKLEALKENIK